MVQPSLITVCANPSVIRPKNKKQWQLFRNTAIAGSGAYFAMDRNGVIEPLGSGGVISLPHVHISFDPLTKILSATVSQGTAPFVYVWKCGGGNQNFGVGIIESNIVSAEDVNTVFTNPNGSTTGVSFNYSNKEVLANIWLEVEDSLGYKTEAFFLLHQRQIESLYATMEFSGGSGAAEQVEVLVTAGNAPYTYEWSDVSVVAPLSLTGLFSGANPINFNTLGTVVDVNNSTTGFVLEEGLNFCSVQCVITDSNNEQITVSGSTFFEHVLE